MTAANDTQQMVRMPQMPPAATGAGAPPTGGGAPSVGAGDVWRILKQRKLLISITFVLLYMLVVAATFVIWKYAPTFQSTAYVRFIPPTTDPFSLEQQMPPRDYVLRQLNNAVAGLTNIESLLDLLKQEEIKNTHFYRWYDDQMDCLYDLKDLLAVSAVRDSDVLRVSLATRRRDESTLIVNMLVQRYVDQSRSGATDQRRVKLATLEDTKAAVEQQLTDVRRRIAELRAQRDMPALESDRDVQVEVSTMLNNTIAELTARMAGIEAQLATVSGSDPRTLPLSAEMKMAVEMDPELRSYRQQVQAMDIQIGVARKNMLGDSHRQMLILLDQRDRYAEREVIRREQLIDDMRARQRESLNQERARIRNTLSEVQEQLFARENELRDLDSAITRLSELTRDEERVGRELADVAMRLREAEHQHTVQAREGRLAVMGRAKDAVSPTRPQPLVYLGGGFVLSMLLAVGLAFLREFTDQAVRTPIDVARFGHLSVLGSVPLLDDEEADIDEVELATRLAPHSLVAEAFRQIRTHLTFSGPIESQRTLLITSPRPEDGKTATAINLAVTFAQSSHRVLLVDCNFRRPGIRGEAAFPAAGREGLSNILVGHAKLADVASQTEIDNLDVLSSGPMPPNPAELLGSEQMRNLLKEMKERYERVILDGPPCLLISDALVVAMQVDGVILVARAANSSKGALRRAREQLQRLNARIIGAILNGVQARPGGYFRQQYREFYEYTNEEVVPRELTAGPADVDATDDSDA